MRYCIYIILCLLTAGKCWAVVESDSLRVGAVELWRAGQRQRMAVYRLGDRTPLVLYFDVLGLKTNALEYRLLHCTSEGKVSDISDYEALEQSISSEILGESCVGSPIPYKHYRLALPNSGLRFKLSGLYHLELREPSEDRLVLRVPIYVHEGVGELSYRQLTPFESYCSGEMQSLEMTYAVPSDDLSLMRLEPHIKTLRNGSNLLPVVATSKGVIAMGHKQHYAGEDAPCFPSGNRYLPLDLSERNRLGIGVDRWLNEGGIPVAITAVQDYRHSLPLRLEQAGWAGHSIDRQEWSEARQTRGEYYHVRFSLRAPEGLDIYMEGAAFDYLPKSEKRLQYRSQEGIYTLTLPMKQGYHEYRYIAFSPDGSEYPLEGNHYATENRYTQLVYAQDFRLERLLLVVGAN